MKLLAASVPIRRSKRDTSCIKLTYKRCVLLIKEENIHHRPCTSLREHESRKLRRAIVNITLSGRHLSTARVDNCEGRVVDCVCVELSFLSPPNWSASFASILIIDRSAKGSTKSKISSNLVKL